MKTEFNLSEKRKKLLNKILKIENKSSHIAIRGLFLQIEDQDKEFIRKLKEGNKTQLRSLLSSILLWFLSDNIKVDEKRLKRMFEGYLRSGFIDNLAGELK